MLRIKKDDILLTPEKFFATAQEDSFFADVNKKIREDALRNPIDTDMIQIQKDWALFANQTIGAENI